MKLGTILQNHSTTLSRVRWRRVSRHGLRILSDTADTSANCINYVCGFGRLPARVEKIYRVSRSRARRRWYSRRSRWPWTTEPDRRSTRAEWGEGNEFSGRKGMLHRGYRFTSLRIRFARVLLRLTGVRTVSLSLSLFLRRNGFSIGENARQFARQRFGKEIQKVAAFSNRL